jgi:hypothetical protein
MGSPEAFDAEAFLTKAGNGRAIATYKAKSYIFRQGTKSAAVFYIIKGRVELSVVSSQGKERVVGMLEPGAFVGEACLAGHPLYLASARASTEATLVRVETATMILAIKTILSCRSASCSGSLASGTPMTAPYAETGRLKFAGVPVHSISLDLSRPEAPVSRRKRGEGEMAALTSPSRANSFWCCSVP